MKRITILAMAVVAVLAMSSCSKKVSPTDAYGRKIGTIPCDQGGDTKEYFVETGTGTSANLANARRSALLEAQNMIYSRLGGAVESVVDSYFDDIRTANSPENVSQSETKQQIEKNIKRMMNDAEKICEENRQQDSGAFSSYIAIRISKAKIIQSVLETMDEVSQIKIDHEKYKKVLEERMDNIKNNK